MEVLLLSVDQELYALPIESFREVVARPRVTRLPTSPGPVLGLVNVRGEIVPLFDVAALIGTGTTSDAQFAAVVEVERGRAAFATDIVPESGVLGEHAGEAPQSMTRGVYRQGDRLATLLDVEATLASVRQ